MSALADRLATLGRFGMFSGATAWRALTPPSEPAAVAENVWQLCTRCAIPVVAVVFPCGMVLALQGSVIFDLYGAQRLLSPLVSVALFREIAPVLAAVLVAAQGGSAYAAELGAMRIEEEIDATEVMAIDALRVHVVPRVSAMLVATPMLNLIACLAGVLGGYVSAVWLGGETSGIYWGELWELTQPMDLVGSMIKSVVFGGIIGIVACWYGFHARGGAPGVGRAVNDTVVVACTSFIVANYLLTNVLFGLIG